MTIRTALLVLLAAAAAAPGAEIFRDDFARYPAGWLSSPVGVLNAAIQEYHYLPHRGVPLEPWANAICHLDAWAVGEEDGHRYLEQHLTKSAPMFANPIFITGDPEWSDYTVEVSVKPLAVEDGAGVAFRYHTNRHYYWFGLSGGKEVQLAPAPAGGKALSSPGVEDPGLGPLRLRRAALLPPEGRQRWADNPSLRRWPAHPGIVRFRNSQGEGRDDGQRTGPICGFSGQCLG